MMLCLLALGLGACSVVPRDETSQTGFERYFRVEWVTGESARGVPMFTGYVFNQHVYPAEGLRLFVDELDNFGQPILRKTVYVPSILPGSRSYFEVPITGTAKNYRVGLYGWEWRAGGGA